MENNLKQLRCGSLGSRLLSGMNDGAAGGREGLDVSSGSASVHGW